MNDKAEPEAGDPVCWLHLACESCGALIERAGDPHRPGCELTANASSGTS
ncbi:MAG TPA: hypothetical protein VHS78_04330 [Candidatus Elarobacter sp.]|nr:hypothetical protein [Candidatus Elarobacter sp.]